MPLLAKFDSYTFFARLLPFCVLVLPTVLLGLAWVPPGGPEAPSVTMAFISLAGAALVAHLARDEGKRKQTDLFGRWGGAPTTILLRHSSAKLNSVTRARYHARLGDLVSVAIPSASQEQYNPTAADTVYESCVEFLREKTRDKDKFLLVQAASREYGFRRNLWGMKPAGLVICVMCLAATLAPTFTGWLPPPAQPILLLAAASLQAVLLVIWLFRITPEWVRAAGFAYAERLLAACDAL